MLELPFGLTLLFILTTFVTFVLFVASMVVSDHKTTQRMANIIAVVVLLWLIFMSTLALNKWYMDRKSMPPHMMFPVITATVIIGAILYLKKTRQWTDTLSLNILTWIHIVRVPVEISLYQLAVWKQLPWSMTFEGYNYDIAFGITAPIVALLHFRMKKMSARWLRIWNILGLVSVMLVVIRGIGSLPSPLQWWDFSQPNYAVMHFPFIWLPAFIVPVVVFSHLVAIRRLRG